MSDTLLEAATFGLGVALSPLAIAATLLTVLAPGGRAGALAFAGSWALALTAGSTAALLLADVIGPGRAGDPAGWVVVAQLALGALLLGVAARSWLRRPSGPRDREPPGWMSKLDGLTPLRASGFAVLLALGKPKNLLLTIGAGLAIAEAGTAAGEQAAGIAVFAGVATIGVAAPLAVRLLSGERGTSLLERVRDWMIREEALIVALLCLLFGGKLLAGGLAAL